MRRSRSLSYVCSFGAAAMALLVVFATMAQAVRSLQVVTCVDGRDGHDDEEGRDEQRSDDADLDVTFELIKADALARRGGRPLPPSPYLVAIIPAPITRPWSPTTAPIAKPPRSSSVRLQL